MNLVPSRELLRTKGPDAYILALAASFPCLAEKVEKLRWTRFDVNVWAQTAAVWSSGERKAALFVASVWNPGYAEEQGWRFDAVDACGTWDTGNRRAFVAWTLDPVWP